jgi:hypothetical protein
MDAIKDLIESEGQWIKFFLAKEVLEDDLEGTKTLKYLNPLPVKAIVNDLSLSKITWNIVGVSTDKAKEIIIDKKWKTLLEKSHKILIDNEYYQGWRSNGKLQFKETGNIITAYVYIKKA